MFLHIYVCVCVRVRACANNRATVWVSCKSWFESWQEQETFSSQNVQANTVSHQQIPAAPSPGCETTSSSNIDVKQDSRKLILVHVQFHYLRKLCRMFVFLEILTFKRKGWTFKF